MDILTIFTDGMDINSFFSTLATASTVFIIVMITFAVHRVNAIDEDIHNKNEEIDKYDFEIHNLRQKNEKEEKVIFDILRIGNKVESKDETEYRKCSKIIMNNHARIFKLELKKEEHKSFIQQNIKTREHHTKSLQKMYMFSVLYIVLPLFFISLPNNKIILISLNIFKILLLVALIIFIKKLIKECKEILNPNLQYKS